MTIKAFSWVLLVDVELYMANRLVGFLYRADQGRRENGPLPKTVITVPAKRSAFGRDFSPLSIWLNMAIANYSLFAFGVRFLRYVEAVKKGARVKSNS